MAQDPFQSNVHVITSAVKLSEYDIQQNLVRVILLVMPYGTVRVHF